MTVYFFDGATQIGSGTLSKGQATFSTTSLSALLPSQRPVRQPDSRVARLRDAGSAGSPVSPKHVSEPATLPAPAVDERLRLRHTPSFENRLGLRSGSLR